MGRSPCCEKVGVKKGPWTPEEDQKLLAYIDENGHGSWRALPSKAGLQRCGKSCRLRWSNYLRPDIKRGKFSLQEEQTIIQLHALLGNRWSAIATHLPKRTDNEIKNYWNTHLKKRLALMGIDPVTHKPKDDCSFSSGDGRSKSIADLSHMAQWESARLEAEARLVRESKLKAPPLQLDHMLRAWQGGWKPKPTPHVRIDLQSPTSTLSFSEPTMGFLVDPHPTVFGAGESWLAESSSPVSRGEFGPAAGSLFTDLLLDNSDASDSGNADSVSCEEEDDENSDYWNSILGLLNSAPPSKSNSPPPVF